MTLITGNTYPVKDQIKALGGVKWDRIRKGWLVPDDRAEAARRLVDAAGKCSTGRPSYPRCSRGTWTGCSCGSVEEFSKDSDCRQCRFDAE
jgi:hypothetical protein